jgi:hypothetical protein
MSDVIALVPSQGRDFEAVKSTEWLIIILTFALALAICLVGVWLVHLGNKGQTHFSFLGARLGTQNVGIAAIALGVFLAGYGLRSSLGSVERIVALPPATSSELAAPKGNQ